MRATTTFRLFPYPSPSAQDCTSLSLTNVPRKTYSGRHRPKVDNDHGVMSALCRQQNSSILRWFKRHKDTAAVHLVVQTHHFTAATLSRRFGHQLTDSDNFIRSVTARRLRTCRVCARNACAIGANVVWEVVPNWFFPHY